MAAQVHGKGPFFYSIEPSLPGGLRLDPSSGTISGTATTPLVQTQFVVTCHNNESRQEGGIPATTFVSITVLEVAVSGWFTKQYVDGSVYTGCTSHAVCSSALFARVYVYVFGRVYIFGRASEAARERAFLYMYHQQIFPRAYPCGCVGQVPPAPPRPRLR